jgi:hypothetical protein
MRAILSPEQVAAVVADIAAWIDGHVARLPGIYPDDPAKAQTEQQAWSEASILSIVQLVEIDELECYHVSLQFKDLGDSATYMVTYILKREDDGRLNSLTSYTFYAPDYTHPTQKRTS